MRNFDCGRRITVIVTFLACACSIGAEECRNLLSIPEVIRRAQMLDEKVVCVRGILIPARVRPGRTLAATPPEMTALEQLKQRVPSADAVGVVDWDKEMGISAAFYKPETFAALESTTGSGQSRWDVTVRAAVMYKKQLLEKARLVARHSLGVDTLRGSQRDVELVLLEIIKVNRRLD